MSARLRLLQVEDSESDAALIVRLLEKAGYEIEAERVEDAAAMHSALSGSKWDAIIADYHLPNFEAPAALQVLQQSGLDLPFIVVSGTIGEDVAVAMMKAGAHDYLMKNKLSRLPPTVEREIKDAQVREQRRQAEESLRRALTIAEERRIDLETANTSLRQSLEQRNTLLREVQHRVKNNLQVVSSMLSLEAERFPDGEVCNVLQRSRDRIRAMAIVHEKFCHSEDLAKIDFGEYVDSLARYFLHSYSTDSGRISLKVDVDVHLYMDDAVPCGLIIQELMSNSMKYAFADGSGEISVEIHAHDGLIEIQYKDNGIGLPASVDFGDPKSLGLQLVKDLAKQVRGTLTCCNSLRGTAFTLTFIPQRAEMTFDR